MSEDNPFLWFKCLKVSEQPFFYRTYYIFSNTMLNKISPINVTPFTE